MDISANGPVSDRGRYRVSELPAHHFASLDDDAIGDMASRAAASEVPWIPDVTAAVTDRLARDAAAYPEVFAPGSRPPPAATQMTSVTSASGLSQTRGTRRSGRLPQLALVAGVVAVCVVGAAVLLGDWIGRRPRLRSLGAAPRNWLCSSALRRRHSPSRRLGSSNRSPWPRRGQTQRLARQSRSLRS